MYGGQEGDARRAERRAQLIEAGLDLLGSDDGDHTLSVRGVCKRAGLATRYFYESFTDRDALIVAVYDHVVQRIATSTLEAVSTAGPGEREIVEAGVRNIVVRSPKIPGTAVSCSRWHSRVRCWRSDGSTVRVCSPAW
jgi:AcrR family transcriptional regulator